MSSLSNKRRMVRKGFFLIFALWLFLLLSLFALGLGFKTSIEIKKTGLFLNRTRAFYLAVSGIKEAKALLEEDEKIVDHLGEDWAALGEEAMKINFSFPKKEGKIHVIIEDESSRANINKISDSMLTELFQEQNIENAEGKANYIVDYIDSDDTYTGSDSESEDNVKNEELSVIEELLLINDISKEDYEKIEEQVTIAGDEKININTASEELIRIAIVDLLKEHPSEESPEDIKNMIFQKRYGADGIEGNDDDEHYTSEGQFPEVGDQKNLLEEIFKINSEHFRIISEGEVEGVKKKITCIIERDSGKIIYWYEE